MKEFAFILICMIIASLMLQSCTSPSEERLLSGQDKIFMCKFINLHGKTKNVGEFQRDTLYQIGDTITYGQLGNWIIVR